MLGIAPFFISVCAKDALTKLSGIPQVGVSLLLYNLKKTYDTSRIQPSHLTDWSTEASSLELPRQDHRQHHPTDGDESKGGKAMIQQQHWYGVDRILITDEEHNASVQLDIFQQGKDEGRFEEYQADCLVWALWVSKGNRKKGVATRLLEAAEKRAASHGCKSIALTHDNRDTPEWVMRWYERRGYKEKAFGRHTSLMVKQLSIDKETKE